MSNRISSRRKVYMVLALLLISFFVLVPIYWVVNISLRDSVIGVVSSSVFWPSNPSFSNYTFVWDKANFSTYFYNTIVVSCFVAVFVILLATMSAYSLSRFRFAGRRAFMLGFLVSQLVPTTLMIVPLFLVFSRLNLINSLWTLIITYTTLFLPFNAILMKGFIDSIPIQLEEAAMIDGCNRAEVILRVLFPLLLPGVVAIGAFAFINSWNEFLLPIMLMNNERNFVISIGLNYMLGQNISYYGALAAGSVIVLVIPLILFGYIQKFLVTGLSAGAVKG